MRGPIMEPWGIPENTSEQIAEKRAHISFRRSSEKIIMNNINCILTKSISI